MLILVKCLIVHYGFDAKKRNEKECNWNAFFYTVQRCCKELREKRKDIFIYMMEKDPVDCDTERDSKGACILFYAMQHNESIEENILNRTSYAHHKHIIKACKSLFFSPQFGEL